MTDLFGGPLLPGLATAQDFVTPAEESALIAAIDAAGLSPFKFQQWEGKRLTRSYGWQYDFVSGAFARAEPMPAWLDPIRERAATFAGLARDDLVQALVIRYDVGAAIGWHRDRPIFDRVVGLSLGGEAAMRFRRRRPGGFERANAPLHPRAAYLLSGEARTDWEHSIAPVGHTRWSVTFRSLTAGGARRAGGEDCSDSTSD